MLKKVLIILLLLHHVYSQDAEEHDITTMGTKRSHFASRYIFLFGSIVAVALTRHLVYEYNVPVPYPFFCIALGILWGVGATNFSEWMESSLHMSTYLIFGMYHIYLPAIFFCVALSVDVHSFRKAFLQILIISGPVSALCAVTFGLMMKLVIDPEWSNADAMLFGSMLIPIRPMILLRRLKDTTVESKEVRVLLEGETLITAAWAFTIHRYVIGYMNGWIFYPFQFIMGILRQFVFGIILAYPMGHLGAALMQVAYSDQVGLMIITIGVCYTGYYFSMWVSANGIIASVTMGIIMGLKRAALPLDIQNNLVYMWKAISCIMSGTLYVLAGAMAPWYLKGLPVRYVVDVLVTYVVLNITRFMCFLIFSPLLSRFGYGITFGNMLICVWAGLKNPCCLDLALQLPFTAYKDQQRKAQIFYLHTLGVYTLLLLLNGSTFEILIRALGLTNISLSRRINMNNCIKYINEARSRTVTILKMDRFLADANWPLVMNCSLLEHPYKKILEKMNKDDQTNEEEHLLARKYTHCPDCEKDIPNEPTLKEYNDMTKEAKLRLLKLRKSAYSRQFEHGMVSMHGIKILHQAVEVATDSENLVIELDGLFKLFMKEGITYRFCRNCLIYILAADSKWSRPPRKQERLWCYRVVTHDAFSMFMMLIVSSNIIIICYHAARTHKEEVDWVVACLSVAYFVIYLVEFILKILGLSFISVCRHGFGRYFRSFWCWIEFLIMWMVFLHFCINGVLKQVANVSSLSLDIVLIILLAIRSCQVLLGFFKYCPYFKTLLPGLIKYLDEEIYKYRALAFELGKNYIAAEEEIAQNLAQIVDNDKIRNILKKRMDTDRLAITRMLGLTQKQSPNVAMMVKTKLAMRMVLNSMKEDVNDLKVSGWVDDVEYGKLMKSLNERSRYIQSVKAVPPPSSKQILKDLPYMGTHTKVIEFLYPHVTSKKFDPGEVVYKEGDVADVIYLLISGMLMATYTPTAEILERLQRTGALPVIDCVYSTTYTERISDYILPGSTIGELSLITRRPYDGIVTSITYSQVYVLSRVTLMKAFAMNSDPVDGLECRIWRYLSFKTALSILMTIPSYRSLTHDKMKYVVERSFVPHLSNYKVFVVNNMMENIILIEGVAVDYTTREVHTAPCYIPRSAQKLVLPKSSTVTLDASILTKLLIIPSKDFNEYEIMVVEEDTCELVQEDSKLCLRHLIKEQGLLESKKSMESKHLRAILDARRNTNNSATFIEVEGPTLTPGARSGRLARKASKPAFLSTSASLVKEERSSAMKLQRQFSTNLTRLGSLRTLRETRSTVHLRRSKS